MAAGRGSGFRASALLIAAVGAVALSLYAPTFRASFAYDDIDYLNAAADHLSGRTPLLSVLFRPQGEHLVPALRLLVAASARLFGVDALPWRLLVFSCHVASALLLAGIARRYFPSSGAALATGIAFVLPAGFSSMWVWFPSGGCVSIGLAGITGAMLAVASRDRLGVRRARLLAAVGVVGAVVFDTGLMPLVAAPALLDEWERRRAGGKRGPLGLFPSFCLVLMSCAVLVTSVVYRGTTGLRIEVHVLPALKRAAFLLLAAPFRLFFPGQHLPSDLGSIGGGDLLIATYGLVVFLAGGGILAALLVPRSRLLVTAAILSAVGAIGFVALVALARSTARPEELFDADRYFFPLLIPVSLLAGAAFGSLRARASEWGLRQRAIVGALVGLVLVVELLLHGFALRRRVPFGVYATHERRLAQLSRLGDMLAQRAAALPPTEPPLAFPDGAFYFPDVHNNRLSARLLLFVAARHRTDRLVLGGTRVSPRDASILNEVFDAWTSESSASRPSFRVVDGELRDARDTGAARFDISPSDDAVVDGIHVWEGILRWAGPRAVLRLRATGGRLRLRVAAPITALRAGIPGSDGIRIAVSLQEPVSGDRHPIGEVHVATDGIANHVLAIPAGTAEAVRDRSVLVVLEGSPAWRPIDVLPGATDERLLTVSLYEVAFEGGTDTGGPPR